MNYGLIACFSKGTRELHGPVYAVEAEADALLCDNWRMTLLVRLDLIAELPILSRCPDNVSWFTVASEFSDFVRPHFTQHRHSNGLQWS